MTKNQIASLASKLLGLYFAVHSFGYLSGFASQLSLMNASRVEFNRMFLYSVTLACFAFTLGIGLYLFFRAEKVASVLVASNSSEEQKVSARSHTIQTIAFSTVGLIITLQAIPHVINLIFQYLFTREGWSYPSATSARTYIDFITSLLQVALGLWLLFGSSTIQAWINKVRGDFQEE